MSGDSATPHMSAEQPVKAPADASQEIQLEYARLAQEREFKNRELEIQGRQRERIPWSAPVVTAIVAGVLGLAGTLWNGYQNVQLERRRQEGTLILEAIKTGTGETKRAAANLLFLGNAELIDLTSDQRKRLEQEAGTKNPVPSLPLGSSRVALDPSPVLTPEVEKRIQERVDSFQIYLRGAGLKFPRTTIHVHIDPELRANVGYVSQEGRLEVASELATDADAVLDGLANGILTEVAGTWIEEPQEIVLSSLIWGLSDYLTCSYQNDPVLGENFYDLIEAPEGDRTRPYLRNLKNNLTFATPSGGPQSRGEVWGGAFWELRERLGASGADRVLVRAWSLLRKTQPRDSDGLFFVTLLEEADRQLNGGRNAAVIVPVFTRRGLPVARHR